MKREKGKRIIEKVREAANDTAPTPDTRHPTPDTRHPTPIRIGFQGEIGAFSELAARRFYADGCQVVPLPTFDALFGCLVDGTIDVAAVPIENSLFGRFSRR